jgi:hypothetical protein
MKLGISYNVFEGEELLEESINRIRNQVDYISIVYQTISNFNIPCNDLLLPILQDLKSIGLVDELIYYTPTSKADYNKTNQIEKRNIGLEASRKQGCTHHMALDTDEYYINKEFKYLKQDIIKNDYHNTACQMRTYYYDTRYELDPPEEYFVPLIFKIKPHTKFIFNIKNYPVDVDKSRMTDPNNFKKYNRNEIQMHHLSYVRDDLRSKLESHGAQVWLQHQIEEILTHYNNWTYPNYALLPGAHGPKKSNLKSTDILKESCGKY